MAYGVEAFILRTAKREWTRAYSSDTLDGQAVVSKAVSTTSPTQDGSGTIDCANSNVAKIIVSGNGTENNKIITRLWTISRTLSANGTPLFIPTYVCKLTWTLGTLAGTGTTDVPAAFKFCDTVQLDQGDTSIRLITDTENNAASVTIDLEGAQFLYVGFDETGITPIETGYNALVSLF